MSKETEVTTRKMRKEDYERIYMLMENGTSKELICSTFKLNPHTLYLRIRKDRPKLAEKIKSLPTSKSVDINDAAALSVVIKQRGRQTRANITEMIEHDTDVLADQVREQREAKRKDPIKKLTPVALPHARNLHALAKTAAMIPEMGLEQGGGASVTVNAHVNHATVMRLGGDETYADDADVEDAIIDVPTIEGGGES